MRSFLFCFILLLCFRFANAQTNIQGKIIDPNDKPIANANVLLLHSNDSSLVKGTLTNELGIYHFQNIHAGKYIISSTFSGSKQAFTSLLEISEKPENISVAPLRLDENLISLQTVSVEAKKPLYQQKIDRLVINVAGSITSAGSTALDVLERSPGITVDRINNSISINSKSGVIIMLNGKRNYMDLAAVIQWLAGIPSNEIERIEIITTPPANFDAEGNAGIINIILKANNQYGTNGSYNASFGYSKGAQVNTGFNINHRKGKLNLFGNYGYSYNDITQVWRYYHAVNYAGSFNEDYSESHRDAFADLYIAQAGADLDVSKKTVIGALLTGSFRHWHMTSTNQGLELKNSILDTVVNVENLELHNNGNIGINFNLQHIVKPDEKLIVNFDYLHYTDDNPNTYANSYYGGNNNALFNEQVRSNKTTPLKFWIGTIDYSKKISEKLSLESGIKATTSRLSNDVEVSTLSQNSWIIDTSLSGNHKLQETIGAAYSSLNTTLTKKTSIKFGLRYELTNYDLKTTDGKSVIQKNYGDLFPSFFFLHSFQENISLNFTYSRRISRPSFTMLAPWVLFLDPKTFQTGNPGLQPILSDAITATYTYKNKMVSASYSYMAHPFMLQPVIVESKNQLITSFANAKSYKTFAINISVPVTVNKWWSMQNNLFFSWAESNASYKSNITIDQKGFFYNGVQSFKLPKDFSFEMSGYYSSGGAFGLYHVTSYGNMSLGFQKKFNNRSSFSFNVRNLFPSKFTNYSIIPEQNLYFRNTSTFGYTVFGLSFNKNFGNDKVKGKRNRSTGSEEEQGRAN